MDLKKFNFRNLKNLLLIIKFFIINIFLGFLSLPIVIGARIFGLVYDIKILPLYLHRIGSALFLDIYLNKEKFKKKKKINFFYLETFSYQPYCCNYYWKTIWSRKLNVVKSWYLSQSIKFFNNLLPFKSINSSKNFDNRVLINHFQFKKELITKDVKEKLNLTKENLKTNIVLTQEEINFGFDILSKYNITQNDKFICFSNRDQNFLEIEKKKNFQTATMNFDYHEHRNSKISSYLHAAENLIKKNYFIIRTGKNVEEKFISKSNKIIDYANSDIRSDFMDIFLASQCEFYLCNDGGLSVLPYVFQKPIVYTNFVSLSLIPLFNKNTLIIFKKIFCKSKKRFLTFNEINLLEDSFGSVSSPNFFEINKNLTIKDSTPEEINDACEEMLYLIDNGWSKEINDNSLQRKFWDIFIGKKNLYLKNNTIIIGNKFLRQNNGLLN